MEELFANASDTDKRTAGMIIGAIEKSSLQEFDYLKFRQSVDGLAKLNMDEATQYKSAFVTASTLGLTREKLIKTANYYRGVVVKEKGKFEKAMEQRLTKGVKELESNVTKLDKAIEERKDRIEKLQAEIEKHEAQREKTQDDIDNMSEKVRETQGGFERAYKTILAEIDGDIANIETYID